MNLIHGKQITPKISGLGLTLSNGVMSIVATNYFTFSNGLLEIDSSKFILQNGNIFGTTSSIGTNDNYPLQLKTNNIVALTIGTNGNISTDNNTTTFKLNVVGTGKFSGRLYSNGLDIYGTVSPIGVDYFHVDNHPNISATENNQIISLIRLRHRGSNGAYTGVIRPLLTSENSAGGQHNIQLYEDGLRIGNYTGGQAAFKTPIALFEGLGFSQNTDLINIKTYLNESTFVLNGYGNLSLGGTTSNYKLDVISATAISARFDGRVIGVTAVNNNEFITLGQFAASASKYIFQNGNSFGLTFSIGTNDNYPLQLKTNNTVALTIATNGFVGIGTLIPTTKLDIRGKLNIISEYGNNGGIYVYANGNVDVIKVVGTGNIASGLDIDMSTSSNVQNGGIIYKHKTGSISPMQIWKSGDNTTLNILDSVGNFGIGIATPIYRLDVISGTSISARFDGRVIGATAVNNDEYVTLGQLAFSASNYFVQNGNSFGATAVLGTNDTQALYLETNNLTRLTIATNGFVGINTTTPTDLFEVRSGTYRRFIVGDGNTAYGGLAIERYANTQLGADEITIRRSRGSFGIGSAVLTGDILGNLQFDAGIGGTATVPFAPSTYISTYVNDSSVISATSTAIRGDIYIGSFVNTTPSLIIRGNLTSDFYGTINLNTLTASQNDILIISPTGSVGRTSSNIFLANSLTQSYFAQNGNSFGTTASIGSIDNYNLQIKSNDVERILISNTGTISFNVVGTPSLFTTSTYIFRGINPAFETTSSNLSFAIGAYNNFTNMSTNTIVAQIDMVGYRNNSTSTLGRIRTTYQGDGTNRTADLIFSVGQSNNVISDRLYLRDNYSQFINRAVIIDNSVRSVTYSNIYGLEVGGSVLFSNILQLSYISGTQTDVMLISPTGTVSRTNSNLLTVGTATFALNSAFANGVTWSTITSKPTTLFGYGITDAVVYSTASYINPTWIISLEGSKITGVVGTATFALNSAFANGVTWSTITSKPTTLFGYGITDAVVYSTASYANPSWITNLEGNKITGVVGTASFALNSGFVNGTAGQLLSKDDRIIEPNSINSSYLQFGFTSFNNNNSSPYADYLHMRSYIDSSGGNDNLLVFNKSTIGIRLYQNLWNSGIAYSVYKDVAFTDQVFLQNGNSFGITASLGTNDNNVLHLKTNNNIALTIATNSYVGITNNLNIGGVLNLINLISTQSDILLISASGSIGRTSSNVFLTANYFAQNGNSFGTTASIGTNDNNVLLIKTNNTTAITVATNGYIGLGTNNPTQKLEVAGSVIIKKIDTNIGFYLYGNHNGNFGAQQIFYKNRSIAGIESAVATDDRIMEIRAYGYDGTTYQTSAKIMAEVEGTVATGSVAGRLTFYTTDIGASTYTEKMRISNNGYVGINTTNPLERLHVDGNIYVTGNLLIAGTSTQINTSNLTVTDAIIELATGQIGVNPTLDSGFIVNRGLGGSGSSNNVAFMWKEDIDEFVFIGTSNTASVISITISNYENIHARSLKLENGLYINNNILFTQSGDSYFNTNGYLGIGTSSPIYKLDVYSTYSISARFSGRVIGVTAVNSNEFITLGQLASSASNYFYQGGNSFGSNAVLGTNDNYILQFKTNNTTKLTIGTNGNIGIGVTNPTSTLHIVSDSATINLNNKVGLYGFFGAALAIQPITSHSVGVLVAANPTDQNDITKTIFRVTDNTYVTPWFNIIGSGNIGVGTSSPLYKLDVVSSATISARFSGRVIGATAINNNEFITLGQLASSASNYFIQNGNNFGATAVLGTNDNQAIQLKTNNITALTIATNGYIGIGTINPLYKIDIDDNIRIKFTNKIYFNDSNTSIGETSGLTLDSGHSTRPIRFLINSVESVRIATNGYVGIGTVSPTTRLQTTGSFSVYNGVENISMTPNNTTTYINLLSQSISTYITANPQPDWSVSLGGSTIPNGVSLLNNSSGSWTNIGAIAAAGGGVRFFASQNGTYSDFWWYHNKTTQLMRLSRFGVLNISQLTGTQSDLLIIGTSGDVGRTSSTAFMAGNYFAQNGNSFDTTAVLGTNDNNDLLLKTNNNTRLIITKEGYVGFGMTSVGMHFNIKNTTNSARILNIMNSGNTTKMYITDDGQYFFTSTYSGSAPFNIQNTGSVRQAVIGNLEITNGNGGWGTNTMNIGTGWMRWITGHNLTMSNVYSFQGLNYLSNPVGSTWYSTSGNLNFFEISSNDYFSPTYGNATFNILNISGGVAQTGTASGITRALYINPSATGNNFKWIETSGTSNPTSSVSNYQSIIFGHTINAKTHSQTLIGMYLNMNITSTYSNVNRYQLYSNGIVAIENNIGGGSIQLLGSNRRIHSHNGGGGNEIDFSLSGFGQLNFRPYSDYNIYHQLAATTSINLDGRRTNLYQQLNLLYSTSNDTDLMIISSTGSVGRTSSNVYLASGLSQSYFMQNGNSFGATAVIGTNDSQQLHLETNGMPRMVVGTNGYIGINTTNPTDTFEIRSSSIRRFVAGDGNTAYGGVAIERYSNNPFGADEITIKRSRGVYNASTPVLNGDLLGSFQWNGGIGGTAADPFIQSTYISTYVNDDSVISATSTVIRGDIHLGSFINSTPTVILRNNLTSDFYGSVNLNTLTASQTDLVIISASGSIGRTSSTIFLADNYFAQNGNSFGATAVLGTIDNQALVFKTNNTQQLIIATNGNILIGTTTDTGYKLNINGTVYVGGTTTFASNIRVSNITPLINGDINILATWAGSTGVFIRTIKNTSQTLQVLPDTPNDNTLGTTNVLRVSNNFSPTAGNGINNALIIDGVINQTGTASGTIRGLYYNPTVSNIIGSHRAIETTAGDIIINGGKLGIGLTSPSYSLDIISGTSISARFDGRVIGATAINDNEFITLGQISLNSFINNGNSFGATAVLGTNDNYGLIIETNGNTNITIATSGNVGIGRQAAYKFDVNGIARVGATDSSGQLYIKGATGTGQYIYLDNGLSIWSFVGGSNFSIKENDNVKFTIKTTNGYVGIGTQNPLQALDIVGNIRLGGTANTVILEGVNGYFDVKPVSNIGLVIRESSDTNKYINIGVNPNNYGLIQYRGSLNIGLYQNGSVALLSLTSSSQTDLMIISPTGSIGRTSSSTFLSGNYFAQNGNSFGATAVLGTIDNTSLQFITNNTERMTILNNGDVTFNGNNMRWYNQVSKLGFGLTATQTILGKIHIEGSDAGNGIVLTRNGVTVSFAASPILAGLFMTSNNPLVFYTNNTERLIIAANGNVGIGTSSPTYKLDVNGTIHAYATFSNGTSEVKLLSHATHSIDVVVPAATGNYGIRIGNTSGYGETLIQNRYSGSVKESIFGQQYSDTYVVTSAKDLTPSDAHVRFEINASEKVRFTNNGYVGIGTNNPTQMLHILSATSRIRLDISTSSGESAIVSYNTSGGWLNLSKYGSINTSNTFGITVSGYSVLNSYGSPFIIGNIDNNPILFGTNNAIRSTITGVGDFGINNLAPQEKLHITGNLRLGLNSGDGYYISWGQDTIASTGDFARIKGIRTSAAGNQAGDLVFYTKPSGGGTSPNERLRILSTGQIGINTSNPTASLHVIGSGLFTDTLYASNLYISGTVTTVNSNNVSISDSIIELATGQMGSNPLYDSGIIINRGLGGSGSIANVGFIWQETSDEFALIGTGNTSSSTTITISNYENLRLNNLNSNILNTNSINILSSGTQSDLLVISPTGSVGRTSSISFLMYGLSQSFFAQGGNSFGNTAVIGTNDNNRLQLKTNNITALTIGTSGNVGIGTTTDNGYKLEISSTTGVLFRRIDNYDQSIKVLSSASGNFITFNQANAKNAYITINDALSDAVGSDLYLAASNTITGTSVNNVSGGNLRLRSGLSTGNNGSASIIFETGLLNASGTTIQNYVSRLIISGNGNVGIGTDTPLEKLHVQGSIYLPNNSFLTIGTAYGSGSLYIRNGASNIMEFTSTGLKSYVNFYADGGSVNNVAYGFYNDRDSGMYLAATNSIGFVTTAIERFRISDNGTLNILSLTSSQTDLMIISTTGSIGRTSSSVFLTANYFAQNGNTFGATAVLGTNDAQALQFEVNGNTRIQLQSTSYSTRFFNNDGNYTSITNRIIEFSRTNGSSIGTYIDGNTDNTLLLYARSGFYINQGGNNIQQLTMTENMFKIRNYSTVSNILFNSSTDVNLIKVTDTGNTFIKTTDSTVNSYGIWLQNGSASTIMKSTNDGWIGFGLSQSYMGSGQTFEVRTNTFGISGTNPAIYIYTMGGTSPRIQFGNGVGTVRITDKQDSKNLTFTSDATNFEFYKMNYSSGTQSIHSFSTHSTSNDFAFKYNTNIIAATSAINLKAVVINPTFSSNGMTSINSTILSLEINTASNISSNNYIQVIEGGNTYFTLSRNNGSSLRMAMGNNTTNAELYHNNSGAHITLATTNRTFLNQSQIILNDAISTISNSKLQVVGNAHILTSSTTSGDALLIQNGTNDVLTVRNNNDILISTSLLKSSIVNNMSIGTYTISTFSTTNFQAAFINYYISSGTNSRVGQIMVNYNTAANSLDFTEITSVDIGDTSAVNVYATMSNTDINIVLSINSGTWNAKAFINAL